MAAVAKVKYSVEGMTCQSCCKTIHGAVSDLRGVKLVEVSLETDSASVVYDVSLIKPDKIKETILDCGFDVETLSVEAVEMGGKRSSRRGRRKRCEVTFDVEGMTCQGCVKTIERVLADLDGIVETNTSLERDQTWIRYNRNKISEDQLKTAIEDCGFDAKVSANTWKPTAKSPKPVRDDVAQQDGGLSLSSSSSDVSAKSPLLGRSHRQKRASPFGRRTSSDLDSSSHELTPVSPSGERLKSLSIRLSSMPSATYQRSSELETKLLSKEGVKAVGLDQSMKTAKVTYDPWLITSVQIRRAAEEIAPSTDHSNRVESVHLAIAGMTCGSCVTLIEKSLKRKQGVKGASVAFSTGIGVVEYDSFVTSPKDIITAIDSLGEFKAILAAEDKSKGKRLRYEKEIKKWLSTFLLCLLFAIPTLVVDFALNKGCDQTVITDGLSVRNLILWIFSTIVMVFAGRFFFVSAYKALCHCNTNMDVLITLATSISYFYSLIVLVVAMANKRPFSPLTFFDTPPLFFAFVALGRLLEYVAKRKTSDALAKLMELQPNEAVRVKLGPDNAILSEEVCNINLIYRNDVVKVIPGTKFPVDGVVVNGGSMVDESMITGEPIPVMKKIGDPVTAGTINQNGRLLVKATGVGGDTMLSQIVRLVEEAQNSKPRVQQVADKVAGVFVPIILLLSLITFTVWSIIGHLHPHLAHLVESNCTLNGTSTTLNAFGNSVEFLDVAFFTAVAVLSIACPCSLALATPTAIMVGTGVGAQYGILIKGGEPLECMHRISTVIFDKTGTLTTGKPRVTIMRTYVSPTVCTPEFALAAAATAERDSEHPLALAVVEYGKMVLGDDGLGQVSEFKAVPGKGVQCKVSGLEKVSVLGLESQEAQSGSTGSALSDISVLIGSRMLMRDNNIAIPAEVEDTLIELERGAQTAVILAIDGVLIATLAIADTLKEDSAAAVKVLTRMGLKTVLLTGDNEGTAQAIADQVGIATVRANVVPAQKADTVRALQTDGEMVAMVGDGINDAIALAQANVGIAIGTGTDVALEAADVVLVKDSLMDVVTAIDLSRATVRRIRMNMCWSLLYNIIAVPIAAGALITVGVKLAPWMAAAAMSLSDVTVVTSSLFLKLYKKPKMPELDISPALSVN